MLLDPLTYLLAVYIDTWPEQRMKERLLITFARRGESFGVSMLLKRIGGNTQPWAGVLVRTRSQL